MRTCTYCGVPKEEEAFRSNGRTKAGLLILRSRCRECECKLDRRKDRTRKRPLPRPNVDNAGPRVSAERFALWLEEKSAEGYSHALLAEQAGTWERTIARVVNREVPRIRFDVVDRLLQAHGEAYRLNEICPPAAVSITELWLEWLERTLWAWCALEERRERYSLYGLEEAA